jgi:osmotically-inducible protein OsmY
MRVLAIFVCAAFLAVSAGCENKPPQPKTEASRGASSQEREKTAGQRLDQATDKAKQSASDAALTAKVKTALANEAGLKTLKIDVDSNAGVVVLKGQVDSDNTKQRVHEVTKTVEGVKWVQNQLSVAPKAS